jgi:hypothetical protein
MNYQERGFLAVFLMLGLAAGSCIVAAFVAANR